MPDTPEDVVKEAREFAFSVNDDAPIGLKGKGLLRALAAEVDILLKEQHEGEMCELCDEMSNLPDGSPRTFLVCGACWNKNVEANRVTITGLRDELAEVTKERDDLRDELEKIKGAGVP